MLIAIDSNAGKAMYPYLAVCVVDDLAVTVYKVPVIVVGKAGLAGVVRRRYCTRRLDSSGMQQTTKFRPGQKGKAIYQGLGDRDICFVAKLVLCSDTWSAPCDS